MQGVERGAEDVGREVEEVGRGAGGGSAGGEEAVEVVAEGGETAEKDGPGSKPAFFR